MNEIKQEMKIPIHIWQIELDQHQAKIQELAMLLSHEERSKAEQFRFVHDWQRYVISHGCCRLILSHYLQVTAQEIGLRAAVDGKPFVQQPMESSVHFNLTHAGEMAYVALSSKPVGIDIEWIDHTLPFGEMTTQFMSPSERAHFQCLSAEEQPIAFYCCWTRKEAYVKALGKGLSYPIRQVTVSLKRDQIEQWEDQSDPSARTRWKMFHLHSLPGYLGAVVGQEDKLVHFSIDQLLQ